MGVNHSTPPESFQQEACTTKSGFVIFLMLVVGETSPEWMASHSRARETGNMKNMARFAHGWRMIQLN
jgi:hypothetical protein